MINGQPAKSTSMQFPNKATTKQQQYINELINSITTTSVNRHQALHHLSSEISKTPNLPSLLWNSPGTINSILGELISAYHNLSSGNISEEQKNIILDILKLFLYFSKDKETKIPFIHARIPTYLLPYLYTMDDRCEFEEMKLSSIGIFANLVLENEKEIYEYLIQIEFIPICLRILKFGSDILKILSAFILDRIINNDHGIREICSDFDKASAVIETLNFIVERLMNDYENKLAKYIINSYNMIIQREEVKPIIIQKKISSLETIDFSNVKERISQEFIDLVHKLQELWKKPNIL